MISRIIHWSIDNRILVLILSLLLLASGIFSIRHIAIDAIPDLSDVQVIIKTDYSGQAPQVVEDQVTYPLTTAMLAVPGAETVRGFSFFGASYVYVIFDEKTDMYWARSRVLEYLNQASSQLPESAKPSLGPDATGVGWVFVYALKDTSGQHDISQLRSLQDWLLKFELQTVDGVAEVAPIGGMVKQYQIQINPNKLRALDITLNQIINAVRAANQEVGASVIEMAEAEYMVKTTGYLSRLEDLKSIPILSAKNSKTVTLGDVADIFLAPQMRRGIGELNGEGETVGGVIVMRYGENAQDVITRVKIKLKQLESSLPEGVEIVPVYDRSGLINNAINNLKHKLSEELILITLICALFLLHIRSSLVAVITLPLGILAAISIMYLQGLNANIMSLAGIAIAIGTMTDGAIVLIENYHKHLEQNEVTEDNRWDIVKKSASEVGPTLFFSLLIITVSFLPVFTLQAQEGRLFSPLAYTKTYAMAAAAILTITLIPVLMGYLIKGNIVAEAKNPINRALIAAYKPALEAVLSYPKLTIFMSLLLAATCLYPLKHIGTEFMPPLNEGDLMYMPTTYPSISIGKARELLQQTNKMIKTVPEVLTVFGKVGRAETATDPAPLTMIETFVQLKPQSQWREGVTLNSIKAELNDTVSIPGISNTWVMPIKTRIDMLATGIKTPIGIKVSGKNLNTIQDIGTEIETILTPMLGTASIYSERVAGGRYLNIDINRTRSADYGLNIQELQQIISTSIGGMNLGLSVEGNERYPINLRYPQDYRSDLNKILNLPIITQSGLHISLGDVASINIKNGPAGIKSENARLTGLIYIDIKDIDINQYIKNADTLLKEKLNLPTGYTISWAGQYEYMQRAKEQLTLVIPLTLSLIFILLFLNFNSLRDSLLILFSLPLSLVGSIWLIYILEYNFSIAVAVGFIALAGVAAETAIIMLQYLKQAEGDVLPQGKSEKANNTAWRQHIINTASLRIRPVMMTAIATIIGLIPILTGDGTGSEVMSRIAAPMVGGMLTAIVLTLFILPCLYLLLYKKSSLEQ